jgi:hypothetical protein
VTKTKCKKNRIGHFRKFVVPLFTSPKRRENYSYVHVSNSTRGSSCCRRGNISAGSLFGAIAEVITRESRERAHGMQQQPQRVNIATNTEIETRIEETRTLYLPNASIQESHVLVSTPEWDFILPFRVRSPSNATVRLPSEAVLLGINVQHCSPNIKHIPPFSASNMSTAMRF